MSFVDQLKSDLKGLHVQAQVVRFVRLAGVAFVAQLGVLGSSHVSREMLVAAAVGAVETAVRQVWPVVPWKALAVTAQPVAPLSGPGGVVPPGGVS